MPQSSVSGQSSVRAVAHRAESSVPAGIAVALLQLQLTVDPCEPRQAGAGVAALTRVHAAGPVHTGAVVCAEVQV